MSARTSRRARHELIQSTLLPEDGVLGQCEATSDATPSLFVTSATSEPDESFDLEMLADWIAFDDDERWRETARTGRAL